MSSSFWVGNDAVASEKNNTGRKSTSASRGVINFADDLEAILLTSLSANLYSCPGVDLYTRKMLKKIQQQQNPLSCTSKEAFVGDGKQTYSCVGDSFTPPLRLQELLPVGHPVRTRVEEIVLASGLPRRIVVPPNSSGENKAIPTIPSTTSTSSSLGDALAIPSDDPDGMTGMLHSSSTTTTHPHERPQTSEREDADDTLRDAQHSTLTVEDQKDSVYRTAAGHPGEEERPSTISVPIPAPQSALAKLVANAKTALPAPTTRTSSSSDEDDEEEEENEMLPFSSRSTALASSASARRMPSSSSSAAPPSIGVKRERSSFLSAQESEVDHQSEQRRREEESMEEKNADSATLASSSPAEGEDREGRRKEGGGAESSHENLANAKVLPKHPSQMTREEFLSQFKRAPRRGEIGLSAEEIDHAEALGYVMSGSRSKAAHLFVNRVQRQLHERDAAKRDQQFRQVEDERNDTNLIEALSNLVKSKLHSSRTLKKEV